MHLINLILVMMQMQIHLHCFPVSYMDEVALPSTFWCSDWQSFIEHSLFKPAFKRRFSFFRKRIFIYVNSSFYIIFLIWHCVKKQNKNKTRTVLFFEMYY